METITVTAKTIEEAITKATIQLGVTSSNLGYDVIEKGSSGFLGIGSKNSVIKAYRKEDLPVEEVKKEIVKEIKKEVPKEKKETPKEKKETPKKVVNNNDKKEESKKVIKETKKQPNSPTTVEKKAETKVEPKVDTQKVVEQKVKKEMKREPKELVKIDDKTIAATKKFIEDVVATMDIKANVVATVDEEGALAIDIDGKNMGVLIGKRGQTLDSLQYLANRVANKEQDGYIRVKLDTENYRERRKKTLENLAKNIASKVKKTRKPFSLEPMNPYERRIIHSALQNDNRVSTHSEGDEPYRRVVVTLAKK